jgi:hypothetical protein
MINGQAVSEKELIEQRKFVAKMLRDAADRVERGERANVEWEDRIITTWLPPTPGSYKPRRRVDGYECRVKLWDEP